VRRFSRRILVDLPSSDDCAQILKKKMDKAGVQFSEKHWNSISDKFYLYSGSGTVITGKYFIHEKIGQF